MWERDSGPYDGAGRGEEVDVQAPGHPWPGGVPPPSTGEGEGDRAILPIGAGASPDLGAVAPAWLVTR